MSIFLKKSGFISWLLFVAIAQPSKAETLPNNGYMQCQYSSSHPDEADLFRLIASAPLPKEAIQGASSVPTFQIKSENNFAYVGTYHQYNSYVGNALRQAVGLPGKAEVKSFIASFPGSLARFILSPQATLGQSVPAFQIHPGLSYSVNNGSVLFSDGTTTPIIIHEIAGERVESGTFYPPNDLYGEQTSLIRIHFRFGSRSTDGQEYELITEYSGSLCNASKIE